MSFTQATLWCTAPPGDARRTTPGDARRTTPVAPAAAAGPPGAPARRPPTGAATGRHAAAAPDRTARRGASRPDAAAVDGDVAAAVQTVLESLLATRLAHADRLGALFTRDLVRRITDLTLHGGHRTRPRLLWWSLRACGGGDRDQVRAALRAGAALELLQTCALVHDDVMDAAPTRRGRPALHVDVARQYAASSPGGAGRLGEAAAVLAGDLALAWADDVVTDLLLDGGTLPAGAVQHVRDLWRTTRTEMVAGQYLDVQGQATAHVTVARALHAASLKSALYTVARPLELGAALAGADTAVTRALGRAGRCAGLAFQLRDDLDDLFADPCATGKPSGGDVRDGKPTYLMAVARARAVAAGDPAVLGVLDASLGRADLTEGGLDRVRDVLTASGTRDLVLDRIERLDRRARNHLAAAGLAPGPAAATLHALLAETAGVPPAGRCPRPPAGETPGAAATTAPDAEAGR
ncbi:polyprenyl synthetase family protein [Streptomyces sp. NPDC007369]|uniref:polyprenyl synthetase family protein n=1 Tax=Streptomyces sp. NPDC007369 TaxID=3154589 RepID=UPI0033DC93A6